ncbi:AP-4 complex subunit epsilon-1 [Gadus macrocephalus]|uniref:AP-4 complex subunit epsilon-1 n=1 Tax=Gadus macrocephalus TaxID=80720 RepID=UPI0028CB6FD6|nr:AP-4 complex subunit epsilon-1 [Gadus macrocephalus]
MSDVVERTLTALPSLLSSDPSPGRPSSTSKLGTLIRGITELTSKHDEEKLIQRELVSIKEQVSSPNTTMRQMKELMVRAVYCEMLGYEASFSYIHAIKLAQQGTALDKRVGYLAVSLFLNESHELLLLLVNTVLKDLQSTNLIEVCMALTVVGQVFPKDMIPAILPMVEEKLNHPKEIIRRKAVLALYKFYLIAPNQVQHIHSKFRKALCDKDPGVMSASLHIYLEMVTEKPESYKDLVVSFVTILKQVVGGKLPIDFNYHSVPAPWLQIQLLRILSLLGKNDRSASEMMYEVLDESLRRAEMNHNITYAILFECVKTIYTIHPKAELLEKAAKCIGNFVLSPKINLKYLGLKALTYVVQQDANLALQHQMTIIECLDHSDLIIKRETLELLFRITNGQNVKVIVEKLLEFLRHSKDDYVTIDLGGKVTELAEKYSPDNSWFIRTMNTVFLLVGDQMQPDIPNSFLRLLSEGFESAEEDQQLRLLAVDSYVSLLQEQTARLPQRFLQVISWVLGEYSSVKEGLEPATVLRLLAPLLDLRHCSSETKSWVLAAMTKLSAGPACLPLAQELAERHGGSLDTTLRQRLHELQHLASDGELLRRVLPCGDGLEPLEVDSSLSFLDGFVSEALAAGAAPYKPPHQRQEELAQEKALSVEPYGLSLPLSLSSSSIAGRLSPTVLSMSSGLSGNSTELSPKGGALRLEGVTRVWGKEGYLAKAALKPEEAAKTEVPCPLSVLQEGGSAPRTPVVSLPAPAPGPSLQAEREKQQLASCLFVGLGSQGAAGPCLMGKAEPTRHGFRKKVKGQGSSSGAREPSGDPASSSHSPSPLSAQSAMDNLLCGSPLDSGSTPSPADSAPSPADSATSPADPAPHLPHDLPANNRPCDAQEDLTEDTDTSETVVEGNSVAVVDPYDPEPQCLSPHLPEELCGLPRSEIRPLCRDASLVLSACCVRTDHSSLLVVFVSNASDSAARRFALQMTSGDLEVSRVCGGPEEEEEHVEGHSVAVYQYSLVPTRPSVHMELAGRASYQRPDGEPQSTPFSYGLSLPDFIRPLSVSTEEYGRLWLASSNDTKQNLALLSQEPDPLRATLHRLRDRLQLNVVDIIASEGIVACQLLQGPPCLMHCRLNAGSLAVWLRSSLPELPDCLLYHCQRALAQH